MLWMDDSESIVDKNDPPVAGLMGRATTAIEQV
jgi:hypothetical protein